MSEEPFLLLSLKGDKAKKLSEAISNDTARKILDYLSKVKDATESSISKELNTPISTIHYNIHNLMSAKLVDVEEFHYSEKGKEVNHYKLANKLIIIAPKEAPAGFREKLKKILPLSIFAIGATFVIGLVEKLKTPTLFSMAKSADMTEQALTRAAPVAEAMAVEAINTPDPVTGLPVWLWFLLGASSVIILYVLIELLFTKRNK